MHLTHTIMIIFFDFVAPSSTCIVPERIVVKLTPLRYTTSSTYVGCEPFQHSVTNIIEFTYAFFVNFNTETSTL